MVWYDVTTSTFHEMVSSSMCLAVQCVVPACAHISLTEAMPVDQSPLTGEDVFMVH